MRLPRELAAARSGERARPGRWWPRPAATNFRRARSWASTPLARQCGAALLALVFAHPRLLAALEVPLATNGVALQPIVISANATAAVSSAAANLATQLNRITGGTFTVQTGSGAVGLAVGRAVDFPALATGVTFAGSDPKKREEYLLRSHANGAWLLGATDAAVKHAVWDFLHRLGYRQYFPGPTWEIVPSRPTLTAAVDAFEQPDYLSRFIWYGYGTWAENLPSWTDWCAKNRAVQGLVLNSGHAYDGIRARQAPAFSAHPEYLALVNGVRTGPKLANANPGLRQLCVDDSRTLLAATPTLDSLSMEPSDGGGWDEGSESAALGSISDQALSLANHVAAAIEASHPGKLVGMYAYNQHSPPPNLAGLPNVVVSIATAFISGGFTVEQLFDGWSAKVATLGVREYYSVNTWDRDLPGAARGGNPTYLRQTIPRFHAQGARFMSAESSENFGPNGLSYFLATRMLWDVGEAANVEALTADFLQKCFGPAAAPMTEFYTLLDGNHRPSLSDDLLGRMFRRLDEAWALAADPAIHARLDALTLYARYVELYFAYSPATGAARQAAFEALLRHAYRMRSTHLVHSLALYRDLDARDSAVSIPASAAWNVNEPANPWKSSAPFTRAELDGWRTSGIANHPLLAFAPVSFSDDLIPAAPLGLTSGSLGTMGIYSRGVRQLFTWIGSAPATLGLSVQAGIIYSTFGPASLDFYPAAEPQFQSVATANVAPDKVTRDVALATTYPGLHRLEVSDGNAGTLVGWTAGTPMTLVSSAEKPAALPVWWSLYFYVPRGTPGIGGFSENDGVLLDPTGAVAHTFTSTPGYFHVPVPPGQDGKLWRFHAAHFSKQLMTVPPCLARSAAELLLPREVVAREVALATGITHTARSPSGLVTLTFQGIASTSGTLQTSVNLTTWSPVQPVNFTGAVQIATYQDTPAGPKRFFRIAVP